ncbi:hypothetical protein J3R82DRAFT_5223 [Butyriboletus roseoflavus]|nr:hypothetical protein J3R82DRAFT_5223 [Butyriboletus roseoflavus]
MWRLYTWLNGRKWRLPNVLDQLLSLCEKSNSTKLYHSQQHKGTNSKWKSTLSSIKKILVSFNQHIASHVVISLLEFLPELHTSLCVPCIKYPVEEQNVVISPFDVIYIVNIQHDYYTSCCTSTRAVFKKQEHSLMLWTKNLIDHAPTNTYIVNTSSLHNQYLMAVMVLLEVTI